MHLRGLVLLILLGSGLCAVAGRCWYLQYSQADDFQQKAAHQQLKIILQNPRRGCILDRKGKMLAVSVKRPSVWVDPLLLEDKESVARKLADILAIDYSQLLADIQSRAEKRYMRVKQWITDTQAEQIEALDIRGVVVEYVYKRTYPQGSLAAHIIGYTDINGEQGVEGIEYQYNEYLAGKPGKLYMASDVKRRPVRSEGDPEPATDGQNVVLTIDSVIQEYVEQELETVVRTYHASSGSAIVMDPSTGELLALANYPTFDLNQAHKSDLSVRRNRALTDPYEPGSTFKPFTVAAGIEGSYISIKDRIDCLEGPYTGKGFGRIREYKNYFGTISVGDIIAKSSNIGVAKIAQKMGADYFYRMIEMFGFGRKTGIDLPGEGNGLPSEVVKSNGQILTIRDQLKALPGPGYTITRVSFGQTIAVTPIQLIRAFSCLANGGLFVKPRIVNGIIHQGQVVKNFDAFTLPGTPIRLSDKDNFSGQVISYKTARAVIDEGMVYVVKNKDGTGHRAHLEEWQLFGKTGTANVPDPNGRGYVPDKWISSFIAGAPQHNTRICVLVIVREPDRSLGLGYTGGAVASPAAREMIRKILLYLGVPPENTVNRSES